MFRLALTSPWWTQPLKVSISPFKFSKDPPTERSEGYLFKRISHSPGNYLLPLCVPFGAVAVVCWNPLLVW